MTTHSRQDSDTRASAAKQPTGHEPVLDGIRGVAILLVLGVHLEMRDRTGLVPNGWMGVDLFFALSGYLITTLLLREWTTNRTISLKRFYARRALRLLPALYCSVGAFVLLTLVVFPAPDAAHRWRLYGESGPYGLLSVLLYVSNWFDTGALDLLWSLSIEEQFYLLWPTALLLCLWRGVRIGRLMLALFAIVAIVCAVRTRLYYHLMPDIHQVLVQCYQWTHVRADSPLIGCIAALLVHWRGRLRPHLAWTIAGWASIAFLAYLNTFPDIRLDMRSHVASPLTHFVFTVGFTAVALACAMIILSATADPDGGLARILRNGVFRWFGRISYSLYLWHFFGFRLALLVVHAAPGSLAGSLVILHAVSMLLAVAMACISYYLIETPFLRRKARWQPVPLAARARA
jgi:peptidoglycan/LPS O-acetylase OafA/YrhL